MSKAASDSPVTPTGGAQHDKPDISRISNAVGQLNRELIDLRASVLCASRVLGGSQQADQDDDLSSARTVIYRAVERLDQLASEADTIGLQLSALSRGCAP